MTKKIQGALGKNAKTMNPAMDFSTTTYSDIGQVIVDSMNVYLETYLNVDDGSALVACIHSKNLRDSAQFSARSARIAYLLGKATILGEDSRKGIVRTQIIEYGAVAEAILLDLVQSVGIQNIPAGVRPHQDTKGSTIDWTSDGLFSTSPPGSRNLKYRYDFNWLINQ